MYKRIKKYFFVALQVYKWLNYMQVKLWKEHFITFIATIIQEVINNLGFLAIKVLLITDD